MVEVLGGQLVLALLLAADAPGCPAHRGFGLALDRLAEEGFRFGKASFGGRLDPGVVELGIVELVGLNPDRPIPMAATQRSLIELGRAQIAAAQIRALQLGAAQIGAPEGSPLQAGEAEIGAAEHGAIEARLAEVGPLQAGVAQVGIPQVCLHQVSVLQPTSLAGPVL